LAKAILLVIFILVASSSLQGQSLHLADCMYSADAHQSVVYLHGIDSNPVPSFLELSNRDILRKLAIDLKLNLITLRATPPCEIRRGYGNFVTCWRLAPEFLWQQALEIVQATQLCQGHVRNTFLFGFSNGAHLVEMMSRYCDYLPWSGYIVASGGAGHAEPSPTSSTCQYILGIVGVADKYNYGGVFSALNTSTDHFETTGIVTHDLGHELEIESVKQALTELSRLSPVNTTP
jgi:hypothetical protein